MSKMVVLQKKNVVSDCDRCQLLARYFSKSQKVALKDDSLFLSDNDGTFLVTLRKTTMYNLE